MFKTHFAKTGSVKKILFLLIIFFKAYVQYWLVIAGHQYRPDNENYSRGTMGSSRLPGSSGDR